MLGDRSADVTLSQSCVFPGWPPTLRPFHIQRAPALHTHAHHLSCTSVPPMVANLAAPATAPSCKEDAARVAGHLRRRCPIAPSPCKKCHHVGIEGSMGGRDQVVYLSAVSCGPALVPRADRGEAGARLAGGRGRLAGGLIHILKEVIFCVADWCERLCT